LALHIRRPEAPADSKWSFDFLRFLAPLRRYEHWNLVLICLLPFLAVGGLLVGAAVVKKQLGNALPVPMPAPIQVDTNAWQKMTDLARADQAVREKLGLVRAASAAYAAAQEHRARLHAYWHVRTAPNQAAYASVMAQYQAEDEAVGRAGQNLDAARRCFQTVFTQYQQLGGAIDYSRQLP
jgi:hypothetical protein